MEVRSPAAVERALDAVPPPVRAIAERLVADGFGTWVVGGSVRDLIRGAPVKDFDLATQAGPDAVLERFPRAVPIGLRHGTVMIPTPVGPVDVTSLRAGPNIEDDLAHRDYTINAMAVDLLERHVIDPHGGRADLAAGRLRAVGSASERLAEDPLRALRGIRLAVTVGLELAPELEAAMAERRPGLRHVPRERVRGELQLMLLSPEPGRALELLRRTGLEADLAPGVRPDAAAVVTRMPPDLAVRLAAWLRGTNAAGILARLRFPKRLTRRVARLVQLHPIDAGRTPDGADLRRLLRRAGDENVDALLALRAAEIDVEARDPDRARELRARIETLRARLERARGSRDLALHRLDLALDGRAVMELLGCGPGPRVGRALRYLTNQVLEDPSRNTPEALRALLSSWAGSRAAGDSER